MLKGTPLVFALSNYSLSWFKLTSSRSLYMTIIIWIFARVLWKFQGNMKQSICQHDQGGFWFKGCCKTPPKYYKLHNTFICLETFVGDGLKSPLRDYKVDQVFYFFYFLATEMLIRFYLGVVAGASEALICGVPSLSISLKLWLDK